LVKAALGISATSKNGGVGIVTNWRVAYNYQGRGKQVWGYTRTRKATQFHAVRLQEFLGELTLCVPEKEISSFVKRKLVILFSSFPPCSRNSIQVLRCIVPFVTNVGLDSKETQLFGPVEPEKEPR
jgi:hypothetical protein